MNTLENTVIHVLTSYAEGTTPTKETMIDRVVSKMVRRGMLSRSVANGEITMNDYGMKILRKIKASMESEVVR